MQYLFIMGLGLLVIGCSGPASGPGAPITNASVQILGSVTDAGLTFVNSPVIQIDAMNTSRPTNMIIVMGDQSTCEAYQDNLCAATNAGVCSTITGHFLPFQKVRTFDLGTLNDGDVKDVSIYYASGEQKTSCFSYQIAKDNKPVPFTADHAMDSTRNPLLSPKLSLNGPESDHCKGSGIPEDPAPGQSKIAKVEVGVGSTSSYPDVLAFSEIDKSLTQYEIPMTGLILADGQKFYSFVRVTDKVGNALTKVTKEWTYTLSDPKKSRILMTLDDGRFAAFNIQNGVFDMGAFPYVAITVTEEAVELNGELYFFGKTDFDTKTHLFRFNPNNAISIINPMNLTLGLSPLPSFEDTILSHAGKIYVIADQKLMEFNPSLVVSSTNPKTHTATSGHDLSELVLSYKEEIYFNAIDTGTLVAGNYKLNPSLPSAVVSLYTSDFVISSVKTKDKCNYFVKSGATLEDTLKLEIHQPLDLLNPDPSLRNPKLIFTAPNAMKGGSFVEGEFYFNSGSLPYQGPNFAQISATADAYNFVRCGNRILSLLNDPGMGRELGIYRPANPLSVSNPGLYYELYTGATSGIDTWIGCGTDNELYFTGRVTGDASTGPGSLFKFNPYAAPGVGNPVRISGASANNVKAAITVP